MKIISADERLKQYTGVKLAIFEKYGIGKTSLLKTLNEPTLCLDFEAGLLAVQGCWDGDSISVRTWEDARDIACLIGGVNPASKSCYSQKHFDMAKTKFKDCNFSKYRCIKSWNDTQKRGVLVSKPVYYSQVQLYMAYMNLDRCLFVALNKDTSDLYFEIIPFDPGMAQKYSDRAVQIIKATENNELLPCVSGDSSFFLCKMCGFRDHCWKNA